MGRRKCSTCGSKEWHKEPLTGLISCSEGHILQSYRNETTEVQELGPHAVRKRDMKGRKEKTGRTNETKLYHGAQGRNHYLLCLQLILRKQIAVLMRVWDLPSEYEIICKDLWTLHLSMLSEADPDEGHQRSQETAGKGKDHTSKPDPSGVGLSHSDDEEESEVDTELEALMIENSDFFSSDSEDDDEKRLSESAKWVKDKRRYARLSYETPVNTVAVLVVACWMLRIPVMYRDFIGLIERYELPYLDPLRCLPSSMTEHLTKRHLRALLPHAANVISIHRAAARLCRRLRSHYGIVTPEANGASILWRVTREMGFTPLVYMMTKRVASERSLGLVLDPAGRAQSIGGIGHVFDNDPVEVQCIAALIRVLKMVYGLDGTPREAIDGSDVAWGMPCKDESMRVLGELNEGERKKRQASVAEIGDMADEKIEEYIDYCEGLLLRGDADVMLDTYFPLQKGGGGGDDNDDNDNDNEEGGSEGRREFRSCRHGRGRVQCGDQYKTWTEVVGAEYSAVLERASAVTGVPAGYINGTVGRLDRV